MTEQPDVQPWPRRVRYPLILLGIAVAAGCIALVIGSGAGSGAVRVVAAAVLIPAVLAPVQVWGRRRRARRERGTAQVDRRRG